MLSQLSGGIALAIIIACAWAITSHKVHTGVLKGPGMGMIAMSLFAQTDDMYSPDAVNFFLRLGVLLLVLGCIKHDYLAGGIFVFKRRAADRQDKAEG